MGNVLAVKPDNLVQFPGPHDEMIKTTLAGNVLSPAYVWVHHMHALHTYAVEPGEGVRLLGTGVTAVSHHVSTGNQTHAVRTASDRLTTGLFSRPPTPFGDWFLLL